MRNYEDMLSDEGGEYSLKPHDERAERQRQRRALEVSPIPPSPPHACPACHYNLTGLLSRICPECGRPFTLADARAAGVHVRDGPEARRAVRFAVIKAVGGSLAILIALIAPFIGRFLGLSSVGPCVLFPLAAGYLVVSVQHKIHAGLESANWLLYTGLIMLGGVGLGMLIFR